MNEEQIEKLVLQYCKENKIPCINGRVSAKHTNQIQSFINNVLLRKTSQQPEKISDIIKRAMLKGVDDDRINKK